MPAPLLDATPGLLAALLLFLFPLAYSPGPGNLFFAALGARYGLRASLPASLGYHVATWAVTVAIGFGFLAGAARVPAALAWIQPLGAVYILWLAWRLARADGDGPKSGEAGDIGSDGAAPVVGVAAGAVLLLLNPKAYVIIALLFTQFLGAGAGAGAGWPWVMVLASVFTLNNLVAFTLWTLAGDMLMRAFRGTISGRWLNRGFAACLALVALWLLLA